MNDPAYNRLQKTFQLNNPYHLKNYLQEIKILKVNFLLDLKPFRLFYLEVVGLFELLFDSLEASPCLHRSETIEDSMDIDQNLHPV